ncbi:MAG: outer membrane beta-barrel protein [Nannocystales bacterium]
MDHEPPPFEERPRYSDEEIAPPDTAKPRRAGGFVSLSAGAGHCGSWCGHMAALGGGRFEAGYRWGHVALGANASLVGGRFDTPASTDTDLYFTEDARGSTRFFHVGPMLQFFPASRGRFDPYVSAGVGFRRVVDLADVEDVDGEVKYWESGLGFTVGAGVPVYVTERVAIGLRYDKTFAVGGNLCYTVGGETPRGAERCEAWSKLTDELNTVDERAARLTRPRPWTVAFEMRVAF